MSPKNVKSAYAAGVRSGIADALRGGRYSAAPVKFAKTVGNPSSDATARRRDAQRFKGDIGETVRPALEQ